MSVLEIGGKVIIFGVYFYTAMRIFKGAREGMRRNPPDWLLKLQPLHMKGEQSVRKEGLIGLLMGLLLIGGGVLNIYHPFAGSTDEGPIPRIPSILLSVLFIICGAALLFTGILHLDRRLFEYQFQHVERVTKIRLIGLYIFMVTISILMALGLYFV